MSNLSTIHDAPAFRHALSPYQLPYRLSDSQIRLGFRHYFVTVVVEVDDDALGRRVVSRNTHHVVARTGESAESVVVRHHAAGSHRPRPVETYRTPEACDLQSVA